MKPKRQVHWGKWCKERSIAIGFRHQGRLAKEIGCTQERVCLWFQMPEPPSAMRKDFDVRLARVLKTDRRTLFVEFGNITPEAAPTIEDAPEHPGDDVRAEIRSALESLNVNALHIVQATVHAIVETAHAA